MAKVLANFDEMAEFYPGAGLSGTDVKDSIGGAVNQAHYKNTCIMRVSWALNYSGHPIPRDSGWFRTKRGDDGKWYGLRVGEFWKYMTKTYGKPAVFAKRSASGVIPIQNFFGKRGIVGFRVNDFDNATGHFTLFDGAVMLYATENYWFRAYEAALWESGTKRFY